MPDFHIDTLPTTLCAQKAHSGLRPHSCMSTCKASWDAKELVVAVQPHCQLGISNVATQQIQYLSIQETLRSPQSGMSCLRMQRVFWMERYWIQRQRMTQITGAAT